MWILSNRCILLHKPQVYRWKSLEAVTTKATSVWGYACAPSARTSPRTRWSWLLGTPLRRQQMKQLKKHELGGGNLSRGMLDLGLPAPGSTVSAPSACRTPCKVTGSPTCAAEDFWSASTVAALVRASYAGLDRDTRARLDDHVSNGGQVRIQFIIS